MNRYLVMLAVGLGLSLAACTNGSSESSSQEQEAVDIAELTAECVDETHSCADECLAAGAIAEDEVEECVTLVEDCLESNTDADACVAVAETCVGDIPASGVVDCLAACGDGAAACGDVPSAGNHPDLDKLKACAAEHVGCFEACEGELAGCEPPDFSCIHDAAASLAQCLLGAGHDLVEVQACFGDAVQLCDPNDLVPSCVGTTLECVTGCKEDIAACLAL